MILLMHFDDLHILTSVRSLQLPVFSWVKDIFYSKY